MQIPVSKLFRLRMKLPNISNSMTEPNQSQLAAGKANGLGGLNGLFAEFLTDASSETQSANQFTDAKTNGKFAVRKTSGSNHPFDIDLGLLINEQFIAGKRAFASGFGKPSDQDLTSLLEPSNATGSSGISNSNHSLNQLAASNSELSGSLFSGNNSSDNVNDSDINAADSLAAHQLNSAQLSGTAGVVSPQKKTIHSQGQGTLHLPNHSPSNSPRDPQALSASTKSVADSSLASSVVGNEAANFNTADSISLNSAALVAGPNSGLSTAIQNSPVTTDDTIRTTLAHSSGTKSANHHQSTEEVRQIPSTPTSNAGELDRNALDQAESAISPAVLALMSNATPRARGGYGGDFQTGKSSGLSNTREGSVSAQLPAGHAIRTETAASQTAYDVTKGAVDGATNSSGTGPAVDESVKLAFDSANSPSAKTQLAHSTLGHSANTETSSWDSEISSGVFDIAGALEPNAALALTTNSVELNINNLGRGNAISSATPTLNESLAATNFRGLDSMVDDRQFAAVSDITETVSQFNESPALLDSVAAQIATTVEGATEWLNIEIHPPELGHLEIRVAQVNDRLVAQIVAQNEQTGAWLDRERQSLQDFLASHGLDLEQVDIFHRQSESHSDHSDSPQPRYGETQPEFTDKGQEPASSPASQLEIDQDLELNRAGINILV